VVGVATIMPLYITHPSDVSDRTEEEQEWLTNYFGLPILMERAGVGQLPIGDRRQYKMPQNFTLEKCLTRFKIIEAMSPAIHIPSFVTVDYLAGLHEVDANVSYIPHSRFKTYVYEQLAWQVMKED
tara:strand:- start:12 stop:389 length:378 start_codon:yes stop_codon:yes gene_type:complete